MKTSQQIIYDSRDWKALERQLSKMDSGQRGKVFEWFCVFYLQVFYNYVFFFYIVQYFEYEH